MVLADQLIARIAADLLKRRIGFDDAALDVSDRDDAVFVQAGDEALALLLAGLDPAVASSRSTVIRSASFWARTWLVAISHSITARKALITLPSKPRRIGCQPSATDVAKASVDQK